MADGIVVKTNMPEFKRQLLELGQRMEKNIVRRATRAAGAIFVTEARRRAPVLQAPRKGRTAGALRRAIRSMSRRSPRGIVKQSVGVRMTSAQRKTGVDPFYWYFLERGWLPRGPGRRIKGGGRRKKLERDRAIASGAKEVIKYRFFKPAFEAAGPRALAAFNQSVADGIAKENAKR